MFRATVHPAPRALIFLLFLIFSTFASAADVFINEIHYDNDGTDTGEGVEIAGPAGTDLSGWQIVLYNGATGASYGTINLTGVIPDQDNGFGTLAFFRSGIQNGDPDGLALVDDLGNVIQLLSYDGEFTATNGPATGLASTDIIVNEPTTSPVGESLQLGGNGTIYEEFSWNPAAGETFGSINNSQNFVAAPPAPNIAISPLAIDFGTVEIGNAAGPATITIANTGTADLTVSAISDPAGEFVLTNLPVLAATIPAGSSVSFDANYLPTDAGADNATITITSDDPDSPAIEIQLSGEGTAPPPAVPVVINEVDSDQDGTDMAEFVELFDGGTGNTDLSGLVLVLFNGTSDVSYAAYDLDGFSTDADGYFVAGNAAVPNVDFVFNNNFLQNGADAIAIFAGDAADFPNGTAVSTANLIDAMVYDTDDADDAELLALLNAGQPQINENGNGNAIGESMQRIPNGSGGARNSDTYALFAPTPGSENGVSVGTEPDIAVSPTAIDFGQITIGANAAATVTIQNNGSADLTVSAISDPGGAFAITNLPTLTATISPGNTATFDVTFSPTAIGATAASVNISSDDPDSPIVEIQLTGEGVAAPMPDIAVSPPAIDFGQITIGGDATTTVTIQNNGSADLTVSAISDPGGTFALANLPTLPATISPGNTATFDATFSPAAVGVTSATVSISSDDPDSPIVEIQLTGEGVAAPMPDIAVSPTAIDFGQITIGGDATTTVTIQNNGSADLTISAISDPGGAFALANLPTLPATIPPGNTATFDVTFSPTAIGATAASVNISSDDPDSPIVEIQLTGEGVVAPMPDIAVSPTAIDFGQITLGANAAETVTIHNNGSADLTVSAISDPGGAFALANLPTLPATISPGNAASFDATFSPAAVGVTSATVSISSDDPDSPTVEIQLTGEGVAAPMPDIAVSPTAIDFGQITIGANATTTVTIQNNGSADLTVSAISDPSGAFALANLPTLPATISPGNTATFDATFSPAAVGANAASISISSDDPDSPIVDIQLTGEGIDNSPPPAQDFVLLANDRINIEKFGSIHGNIHSNDKVEIEKGRNGVIYGNISAVESIEIEKRNTVDGDVISPETDIDGTVNGSILEASVDAVPMPQLAQFTSGKTDIYVHKRGSKILPPGSYDDIEVDDHATLQLSSGDYFAEDLTLQSRAKLVVDVSGGPVNLYLEEDLQLDERAEVEISGGSTADFTVFCGDDRNIKIREKAIMRGNLIAPNATVKLEDDSYLKGAIIADRISIEKNVVIVSHSATILPKAPQAPEEIAAVPETFELRQNYPNPFNPTTTIQFGLPVDAVVSLNIYNARGQLVKTLANGVLPAGMHQIIWNGTDERGVSAASGMYFYMLQSGDFRETRRMILLK